MRAIRLQVCWILVLPLFAGGADPFTGVWKLDSRKSKFTIGDPSFMFATMQIESSGNGLKSTVAAANGEGLASNFTFNCSLNGTPCEVVAATPMSGSTAIETIELKRVDDRTITARGMKNGRLIYADTRVVSEDGSMMTVTRRGTAQAGRKYESIIVLVRAR